MTGYQELRESAAWFELPGRGKLRVTGEDRARLLHAMTTNHIEQLQPGHGCYAFFLNAQGRILADVTILCREDKFILDTEPETATKVAAHLEQYIIADDVTVEDLTSIHRTIAVEGPRAEEVLARAGCPVPQAPYAQLPAYEGYVVRMSYTGSPGFLLFMPTDVTPPQFDALQADAEAVETVRVENGKPRYSVDISERFLAQETSQDQALHLSKGCYLGQEIVERVRSRAQLHRRLARVELATSTVPAPGSKLQLGGRDAAEITSAVYSPALGHVVALAYVRVDVKPEDLRCTAN